MKEGANSINAVERYRKRRKDRLVQRMRNAATPEEAQRLARTIIFVCFPRREKEDGAPYGNKNAAKDRYLDESSQDELKKAKDSGRIKMTMNSKSQSKHFKGSKKYNDAVKNGDFVSIFSTSESELDLLIKEKSGTGKVYINKNSGHVKETVDCGKTIGSYVTKNGKEYPTSRMTIHHSKNGYHAVPASSDGKKE